MSKSIPAQFLLIDDDAGNNMISKLFLKKVLPDIPAIAFTDPEKGVEYILGEYAANPIPTVLLLDINMPVLTGWQVLDKLGEHADVLKENLTIYMLSSSVNPADKRKADEQKLVTGYLEKPLSVQLLSALFL